MGELALSLPLFPFSHLMLDRGTLLGWLPFFWLWVNFFLMRPFLFGRGVLSQLQFLRKAIFLGDILDFLPLDFSGSVMKGPFVDPTSSFAPVRSCMVCCSFVFWTLFS